MPPIYPYISRGIFFVQQTLLNFSRRTPMTQQITCDNRDHSCPFYQISYWLIHDPKFRDLKPEAKLLFGLIKKYKPGKRSLTAP